MPRPENRKRATNTNALTHGLTSRRTVLPGESATIYQAFEALLLEELQPLGATEEFLAHRVVAAAWRLLRVERLEGSLASPTLRDTLEGAANLRTSSDRIAASATWHLPPADMYKGLAILARHEAALERSYYRALATLRDLQLDRATDKPQRQPAGFSP
jgi:hypothetical protein